MSIVGLSQYKLLHTEFFMIKKIAHLVPDGMFDLNAPLFFISPYKCGSTMLFAYAKDLLAYLNIKHIDYPSFFFNNLNKIAEFYDSYADDNMYVEKMCYLGHREVPKGLVGSSLKSSMHAFLLVRDPRDALVSMYFSFLGTHAAPRCLLDTVEYEKEKFELQKRNDIDSYVLNSSHKFLDNLNCILDFCKSCKSYTIVRYEDVIFNKSKLIERLVSFIEKNSDLNEILSQNCVAIAELSTKHDYIPEKEMLGSHVRKAIPGDWKEKLKAETAFELTKKFEKFLDRFYPDRSDLIS